MAETTSPNSAKTDASEPPPKPKSKILIVAIAVVVCLVLSGGAYIFLSRRAIAGSKKGSKMAAQKKATVPVAEIQLKTFVVNLADPDGNSFLRVGITLGLDKPLAKGSGDAKGSLMTPEIRDAILGALTTWSASELLAAKGKAQLKEQLLAVLQKRIPQLGIAQIYFTDFLIQQ